VELHELHIGHRGTGAHPQTNPVTGGHRGFVEG
jgi:hypothetical protein